MFLYFLKARRDTTKLHQSAYRCDQRAILTVSFRKHCIWKDSFSLLCCWSS